MRALVLEGFGRLEMREVDRSPVEGAGVRVASCGICGSDVGVYLGKPIMRQRWQPPLILGHEVGGVAEQGRLAGRAVAVNPILSCGGCGLCRLGRENLCRNRRHVGFHLPGGFAEYLRVPEEQLVPLPDGVEPWKGALAEPLAVAIHAVGRAGDVCGRRVLVLGGGGIGALASWVLRRSGATVTILEVSALRRRWLEGLSVAEVAGEVAGEFEVVLDTVGTSRSLRTSVERCAPAGKVVVVGLGEAEVPVWLSRVVVEEVAVEGSYTYTRRVFNAAVNLLAELPDWPWERRPAEEANRALQELAAGGVTAGRVLLTW
ncbi:2-dehydro-3-deoxy-L-rhamnonate dehydrogenase (NAD(+)) [bacterium HR32]|nr:2-dehydro-3-deoxy-L-rhamnonate dehydrogenase (NAD(+)) [bacterium HR32]